MSGERPLATFDAPSSRGASMNSPTFTRRADGARFRITAQARSIDGPVELLSVDGRERVSTKNDRLAVDFERLEDADAQRTTLVP